MNLFSFVVELSVPQVKYCPKDGQFELVNKGQPSDLCPQERLFGVELMSISVLSFEKYACDPTLSHV